MLIKKIIFHHIKDGKVMVFPKISVGAKSVAEVKSWLKSVHSCDFEFDYETKTFISDKPHFAAVVDEYI
jgi:hypothetical protein